MENTPSRGGKVMATLFFWAVFGALAGAFAKFVLWDDRRESLAATTVLGIIGGLAGGFLRVRLAGPDQAGAIPYGFDGFGMLAALLGAALLVAGYHLLVERRPAVHTSGSVRRHAA
jgi:uncharacterized membrane protein YeaQ/YmgE (transglycosylase-associated protein family)